jgi:hypothetical protein
MSDGVDAEGGLLYTYVASNVGAALCRAPLRSRNAPCGPAIRAGYNLFEHRATKACRWYPMPGDVVEFGGA